MEALEALLFISVIAITILILYLWVAEDLVEGIDGIPVSKKGSSQTDQKIFGEPSSVLKSFTYSSTVYCDTGEPPDEEVELFPNAEYKVSLFGEGFVKVTIIPIRGAAGSSVVMTLQQYKDVARLLSDMKNIGGRYD